MKTFGGIFDQVLLRHSSLDEPLRLQSKREEDESRMYPLSVFFGEIKGEPPNLFPLSCRLTPKVEVSLF